jgi:hypothetical protein
MEIEAIRSFRRAMPFKPFTLVLKDGRKLPVEVPYRLGISPMGNEVVYASPTDGALFISVGRIRSIEEGVSSTLPEVRA